MVHVEYNVPKILSQFAVVKKDLAPSGELQMKGNAAYAMTVIYDELPDVPIAAATLSTVSGKYKCCWLFTHSLL